MPLFTIRVTGKIHQKIEHMLHEAGWSIQTSVNTDQGPAAGLAIRDFPLARAYGSIDYLLCLDGKAVGLIETMNEGRRPGGIPVGCEKYSRGLPFSLRLYTRPLPFLYQTNGSEICFTNAFDPEPRPRTLHGFHRPETLQSWLADGAVGETPRDMAAAYFPEHRRRGRTFHERVLINMPNLETRGFSSAEIKAVQTLEDLLKLNRRRILMALTTDVERHNAMRLFGDRLLRFVDARRILILLEQEKDIDKIMRAFQDNIAVVDQHPSSKSFTVQTLNKENPIDLNVRLCISTIEALGHHMEGKGCVSLPIETFEVIVIDQCSASALSNHRRVLEHFDAYIIGLSGSTDDEILDFFNENISDLDQQEDGLGVIP